MTFDHVEIELFDALSKFCSHAYETCKSDGLWTSGIKTELSKVGANLGYVTCATGADDCEPEWLYDLLWYKSKNGKLTEVKLVVESEWSTDEENQYYELIYDFEKLLLAKATYKLFIFQAGSNDIIDDIICVLKSHIDAFDTKLTNEIYLFAGLNTSKRKFCFNKHAVQL